MTAAIRIAVVGAGHMGQHHARVVDAHPECVLAAVVDLDCGRAEALAATYGARALAVVPTDVDALIVATPTVSHGAVAADAIARGQWCLVEKPLARTAASAEELCGPRVAVGHVERFNPAVRAAGPMQPRFVEARRLLPPSGRADDVCVVMDLMVHDLDLLLYWSGSEVERIDAVGVAVRSDDVDVASVRLRMRNGLRAHLFASRVSEVPERLVRVYEEARTTRLDLLARRARRDAGPLGVEDDIDGLTAQFEAFVRAIRGDAPIAVPGVDGLRTVRLAEQIRTEMSDGGPMLRRVGAGGR